MFDTQDLADRYIAVWNEASPALRRKAIEELWSEDGSQNVASASYTGYDEIEQRVIGAYEQFVAGGEFVFRSAGDADGHNGVLTFTAEMVPPDGGAVVWSATIFVVVDAQGRIVNDYHFPHGETAASTRAVAEEFLTRMATREPEEVAELFADRVDWKLDWPEGEHPDVPWIRDRSTRAGVAEHFSLLREFHSPGEPGGEAPEIVAMGRDAVIFGEIRQTVRSTGTPYRALFALRLVVEDGLIVGYHVYEDSLAVAQALSKASGR